ncbi:MAG: hypothetical protein DMF10_09640 [Verrucomicrobia bacterium]|nr:MAG: hypothetical protein DMF10_09640 [Verrucomicrobiota bacterium]
MKWFQQNRSFGMFLIGFGICALLAVALLYWRWSAWSGSKQAFDQVATERNRLEHLDPFPSDDNYRKLQDYVEKYKVTLDKFKETLKTEVVPVPPLAPNEFQSRLRLVTIATLDRARVNNVRLPDKFELGFDEFTTTMPATEEGGVSPTPAPSPTAGRRVVTAKPGATPLPTLIQRNIVDVAFKAAPSAARKVLNEIASSTGQFFIIRTLYVHNEKEKGPPREKMARPTPAERRQANEAQPGAGTPLNFIVGNEHIDVSATVEMLRFTF